MLNDRKQNNVETSVFAQIRSHYDGMTTAQKRLADYILQNPDEAVLASISDLAQSANLKSEASIVRFYRSLGFTSFRDFKIQMAQDQASRTFYHSTEDLKKDDSMHDVRVKFFSTSSSCLAACIEQQSDEAYEEAMQLICNSRRIILTGFGASAALCYYLLFRLTELGFNCLFFPDPHITSATLAQPLEGDLLICISVSGETLDIIKQLDVAPDDSVSVLTLTGHPNSTIARRSNCVLPTISKENNVLTDAMNTRLVQMCTIDTLYSMLSIHIGNEAFWRLSKTREVFRSTKLSDNPR